MLLSVFGFLIILGPLVVIHEFGHYFFARIFGVKAEIFSIGFGPTLFRKQLGETELRVSAIPLGGYVKLLGEDREAELSPELQKRALHRQAPWKRFFIFFGGPLFNFLFAIVLFMATLAIGDQQIGNVVGRVVQGSVAAKAGFESGDRVISIDGKLIQKFEEIANAEAENPGKRLDFEVVHPGSAAPVHLTVMTSEQSGFSVYGEVTAVGDIDGLLPHPRAAQVGVSDPASLAGKAGITTGDLITDLNGAPLPNWEILEAKFREAPVGTNFQLKLAHGKGSLNATLTKSEGGSDMGRLWGLHSSELFIDKAIDKSPAQVAGIRTGDRLIAVGPQRVLSFFELKDAVQHSGETAGKVDLSWERDGKVMAASIVPTATTVRDPVLKKMTNFTVGIAPMLALAEPVTIIERTFNPLVLLYKGTERMVVFSWRNFVSIRKMFTGDVSVATLGGPILIGKIAGESLAHGLVAFLTAMAMFSIGLGVLNVLPIPVLDGGHLLLLGIEAIRRKPLTLRQMEIIQGVGLSLILLLMVVVMRNDLTRL